MKEKILEEMKDMDRQRKIEFLKERMFMLEMIDKWDSNDRDEYRVLMEILRKVRIGD